MRANLRCLHLRMLAGAFFTLLGGVGHPADAVDNPTRGLLRTSAGASSIDEAQNIPLPRAETGMHTAAINQAAVTADGRLLTVSDDKTARLWRLDVMSASSSERRGLARPVTPQVLRVPIGARNEGKLYTVAASPIKNRAIMAGSTGLGRNESVSVYYVFDLATGQIVATVSAVPGSVRALSYSKDGRYIAMGSGAGWLRVVDLQDKSKPTALYDTAESACKGEVTATQFLRDGRLVTACQDGLLRLYSATFQLQKTYRFPASHRPWKLAVSPQEDKLAVGSQDETAITLFSLADLKPLQSLRGDAKQRGNLSVLAWIGNSIFGAGTYGDRQGIKYLRAWNLSTHQEREWPLAEDTINDLTPLPDGRLAYVTAEPSIGIVDPTTAQVTQKYQRPIADFRDAFDGAFAVSEDGTVVDFGLLSKGRSPVRFDLAHRTLTRNPPPRSGMHKPSIPATLKNWRNSLTPTLAGKSLALDQHERSLSAASTNNGNTLIGGDYSLQLWNASQQRWNIDVPAPAWAVNLTRDGRFAVVALGDGTIRWYETGKGRELLALFATTDGRWLAWNPEGYFDHSESAADLIGYHLNQDKATPRFVLSGQMHERFYRPDILGSAILGSGSTPTLVQADNVKDVVIQHHAPNIKFLSWCIRGQCTDATTTEGKLPPLEVDAPEVGLRFSLEDKGSGIGNLVVRRNLATVATRGLTRTEPAKPGIVEQVVALEPGDNLITVTAFDASQTLDAGEAMSLPIHYRSTPTDKPVLFIVSVGIDQYAAPQLSPLRNAISDAKGIVDRLTQNSHNLFGETKPTLLLNAQARLTDIKEALRRVANQAKPKDLVVLFLAGHGVALDGRYYFLPQDVEFSGNPADEKFKTTALAQSVLSDLISALPTSRVAILIDSCNSGAFAIPDSVSRQAQDRTWTGAMGQNTGRFILAGTSSEQEALDGINGHGIFTTVLLSGLNGAADQEARGNKDNQVDIVELSEYTRQKVPDEAHKIAPSHAQNVTGFFMGFDFFTLSRSGI